jgi:putative peptidoglycan lipid II flippase
MMGRMSESLSLSSETRGIARNASILALGNVTSRVLGLVREMVKAKLFGSGPAVDALNLVIIIINQVYDLVTGGIVNSALVPVFNEYTAEDRREDLWRLASLLLTLATAAVATLVLGIIGFAPQVVAVFAYLGGGKNEADMTLAVGLLRLASPAVVFLSLSGILTSLLYALRRFTLPAFTGAMFNLSMVIVALLLWKPLGVTAMALGALIGAAAQMALQLPGLRQTRLRLTFNWRHAGLRRIFRLYLPIIGVTLVSQAAVYFGTGVGWEFKGGLSWMYYATTLYQFPLGLVATAVSVAILPTLALQAREAEQDFKPTLVQGLNLVLLLIVPATVGLFVLARPIVGLVFERGAQTASDTTMTALVLQVFLVGLSFAAVDQVLIFAFYARQDTLTPALVGILSVGIYVALVLLLRRPLGIFSLMVADSVKQITHALVTGARLSHRLGGFRQSTFWPTLGKILLAAMAMGLGVALAGLGLDALQLRAGFMRYALEVSVPGVIGVAIYFALVSRLGIAEARRVVGLVQQKLGV